MVTIKIKQLLEEAAVGKEVMVQGWVRTKRESKNVIFIALHDGSTFGTLQVVGDPSLLSPETLKNITTGASIQIKGQIVASQGGGQQVELQAHDILVLGVADAEVYPLQPKQHSMEFLRTLPHLRFRTNTLSAVFRIRHALSYAIHQFFHERGFIYLHTPIITTVDTEGAGEMFTVSSLNMERLPRTQTGEVDFEQDFFGTKTSLTVSGQLCGEAGALALGQIYTFGPTFRAENSNTTRHLAEFWMIEPEMAFYTLQDNMALAEALIQALIRFVLTNCQLELTFLNKRLVEASRGTFKSGAANVPSLFEKLESALEAPFARITYTEAFEILKDSPHNKHETFSFPVQTWGLDLQSEHERYLVEEYFKKPVIVTDYPAEIKAFYMRQNDDNKTVAAMDILVPGIGEIVGGSQREERLDRLQGAMERTGMDLAQLDWYLDTRRFGTVPHSGFGLGFERMVQFVTGMENIRDVIPFPRTPGNAAC